VPPFEWIDSDRVTHVVLASDDAEPLRLERQDHVCEYPWNYARPKQHKARKAGSLLNVLFFWRS
jgi:hypothetical protein